MSTEAYERMSDSQRARFDTEASPSAQVAQLAAYLQSDGATFFGMPVTNELRSRLAYLQSDAYLYGAS